jgi:hypothetical protein
MQLAAVHVSIGEEEISDKEDPRMEPPTPTQIIYSRLSEIAGYEWDKDIHAFHSSYGMLCYNQHVGAKRT